MVGYNVRDKEETVVGYNESQVRGLGLALQSLALLWIFLLSESSFRTSRLTLLRTSTRLSALRAGTVLARCCTTLFQLPQHLAEFRHIKSSKKCLPVSIISISTDVLICLLNDKKGTSDPLDAAFLN